MHIRITTEQIFLEVAFRMTPRLACVISRTYPLMVRISWMSRRADAIVSAKSVPCIEPLFTSEIDSLSEGLLHMRHPGLFGYFQQKGFTMHCVSRRLVDAERQLC